MWIKTLIEIGKAEYGYTEDDLELFRQAYRDDPEGLVLALSTDPLIALELRRRA
jgi:hypothetical protein